MRPAPKVFGMLALLATVATPLAFAVDVGAPTGEPETMPFPPPPPAAEAPAGPVEPATGAPALPVSATAPALVRPASPDVAPVPPKPGIPPLPGGETPSASTMGFFGAFGPIHSAMKTPLSGDADLDFARLALAQADSAIEAAKVVLDQGKDPDLRMVAGDVLKEQGKVRESLLGWLAQHGPKTPDMAAPPAGKPKAPAKKSAVPPKTVSQLLDEQGVERVDGLTD